MNSDGTVRSELGLIENRPLWVHVPFESRNKNSPSAEGLLLNLKSNIMKNTQRGRVVTTGYFDYEKHLLWMDWRSVFVVVGLDEADSTPFV